MEDWSWKTWILIIVLMVGIAFETIKRFPGQGVPLQADSLRMGNIVTTPYQVKFKRTRNNEQPVALPARKMPKIPASQISREDLEKFVAANSPQTSEFGHAEKGGEGTETENDGKPKKKKKKKKGEDDEYEIVVDPTTGKRYRRKKKKKDPVEEEAQVEVAKEEPRKEETPRKEEDYQGTWMNGRAVTQPPPPPNETQDPALATLEDWIKRLLNQPNRAETARFIEAYRDGSVTADTFYKIASMMIEDSRPEMKELGVVCLGLTPSVMSFGVLAKVIETERSGDKVRTYAESYMARYGDLGNLHILERILKAPHSSFTTVLAAKRLDSSANLYLNPARHKPPKNPTPDSVGVHSNAGYYQRFVKILTELQNNPDAQINEQARITLAHINQLINTSGVPPTDTPPNGQPDSPPAQASTQL